MAVITYIEIEEFLREKVNQKLKNNSVYHKLLKLKDNLKKFQDTRRDFLAHDLKRIVSAKYDYEKVAKNILSKNKIKKLSEKYSILLEKYGENSKKVISSKKELDFALKEYDLARQYLYLQEVIKSLSFNLSITDEKIIEKKLKDIEEVAVGEVVTEEADSDELKQLQLDIISNATEVDVPWNENAIDSENRLYILARNSLVSMQTLGNNPIFSSDISDSDEKEL